jgi:hypothetical protein
MTDNSIPIAAPAASPWRRAGLAAWALALALVLVLVCLCVSRAPYFLASQMNSDALLGPSFGWDVLHHPGAWHGFELARASGVFPDLVLQVLVQAVTPSVQWAIFGYMLAQFAALVLGVAWFARRIVGAPFMQTATVALIVLSLAIAADNMWTSGTGIAANYLQCCLHTGGVIGSLLGTELALRLTLRWRRLEAAVFFVWSAALMLSDKLLLFSYLAPCCLAALATGRAVWRRPPGRVWALIGLAVASIAVGLLLDGFLYREADLSFHVNKWSATLGRFVIGGSQYAVPHLLVVAPFVLAPLAIFLVFARYARQDGLAFLDEEPQPAAPALQAQLAGFEAKPEPFFLWVFAALALTGVVLLMALFLYEGIWSFRYLAPVLIWPLIFTVAALCRGRILFFSACIAGGGALALTLLLGGWRGQLTPGPVAWRSATADCVTQQGAALGLKAGIAAYWQARPAMMASDWRAQMVQAAGDGRPYEWGNDRFWYTRDFQDSSRPPVFNYFVMPGLDDGAVRMRFGAPDRTFTCPNDGPELWIYNDGPQVSRTFLKALPWLSPHIEWLIPHDHVRLQGEAWRIEPEPGLTLALFGPYVDIQPGPYRLDLVFEPADPADCARLLDGLHVAAAVTANHGVTKIVRQAPLALHRAPGAACALAGSVSLRGRKAVDVETPIYVDTPAPVLLTHYSLAPSAP